MTVWKISSPSHAEDWVHWWLRCFPMTRASLAKRFLESATSMGGSWLLIPLLAPSTRATEMSCQAVCTAGREGLEEAGSLPDCAPYSCTLAVLFCRVRPMASRHWQDCARTPRSCVPNCRPLPPIQRFPDLPEHDSRWT